LQTTRSSHGGSEAVNNGWYNYNYNDDEADEEDYANEEDYTDEEDMSGDDAMYEEDDHDDIYHEANSLQNADWELDNDGNGRRDVEDVQGDDDHLTDHARSKKIRVAIDGSGTWHGNTNGSK
jgi:hypothetical protein